MAGYRSKLVFLEIKLDCVQVVTLMPQIPAFCVDELSLGSEFADNPAITVFYMILLFSLDSISITTHYAFCYKHACGSAMLQFEVNQSIHTYKSFSVILFK